MSFAQEMKDFIAAFSAGSKVFGSGARDDREYKRLRNQWLMQRLKEYPRQQQDLREDRELRRRALDDNHEFHERRMRQFDEPDPNAPPSADEIGGKPRSAIDTGTKVSDAGEALDMSARAKPDRTGTMSREAYAFNYFLDRGYTPVQAAGIVGGLRGETANLNTTQKHDDGIGLGIAGWNQDRLTGLKQYATKTGGDIYDLNTQLSYVDHELKTTESGAFSGLQKAKTPAQAGQAMLAYFRPKDWNKPGAHPERARYAVQAFNQYGGSAPVPPGAAGNDSATTTTTSARSAIKTPSTDKPLAFNDDRPVTSQGNPLASPSYNPWSDKTLIGTDQSVALPDTDQPEDENEDPETASGGDFESGGGGGAGYGTGTAFDFESPAGFDFSPGGRYSRGGLVKRYAEGGLVDDDPDEDAPDMDDPDVVDGQVDAVPAARAIPEEGDETPIQPIPVKTVPVRGSGAQPGFSMLAVRDALATGAGALRRGMAPMDSKQDATLAAEQPAGAIPDAPGPQTSAEPPEQALDMSAKAKRQEDAVQAASRGAPRTRFAAGQTAGGGAMPTPQEFMKLKDMVDPEHKLPEGQRTAAAYARVHEFYMQRGEPEKAAAILGQMLAYNRQMYTQWMGLAAAAAQDGNMDGAAKAVLKAYANVPDGSDVQITRNADGTLTWSQMDPSGGIFNQGTIRSPDEIFKLAMGYGGAGTFDHLVETAVKGPQAPAAEQPMKQSDRIAAEKFVVGESADPVPSTVAPEQQETVKELASQIYSANGTGGGVTRGLAIRTAGALLNPEDKSIQIAPQPDGSAIARLSDDTQITIPRLAAAQIAAARGKALKLKQEAEAKAKADAEKRAALEKIEQEHEKANAAAVEKSVSKMPSPRTTFGVFRDRSALDGVK